MHAVIDESRIKDLFENTQVIVNAQRVGRLAEPHARNIEGRPAFDNDNFYAAPCEDRSNRQSANTASGHQDTSNLIHDSPPVGVHSLRGFPSSMLSEGPG